MCTDIAKAHQDAEKRFHWVRELSNCVGLYSKAVTVILRESATGSAQQVYIVAKVLSDSMDAQLSKPKAELAKKRGQYVVAVMTFAVNSMRVFDCCVTEVDGLVPSGRY